MNFTLHDMIEALNTLTIGTVYKYASVERASSGACELVSIDQNTGAIKYKRNRVGTSPEAASKIESINGANVAKLADALSSMKAVEINALYGGSGNFRSALEALAANTSNIFVCQIDGKKHIFWDPNKSHPIGQVTVAEAPVVYVPLSGEKHFNAGHGGLRRQLITYGAPGTGKSFNIDKIVNDKGCVYFRTTFHPDSDYASFVGCYKPIVKEYDRIVAVGKKIEKAELDATVPDELRKERKIEYTFVEQAFTKAYVAAWKNKASAIANGGQAAEPVYLIIEEINRGNCAQVFGDIFQLLDREGGFSKYPICADDDLHRHLEGVFKGLDFGSQYAKVQTGEELVLPDNLYIWATMNTSDQSLFPMDSAFKRRWDWEYVPISEGVDENTKQKLDWNIVVKDVEKQPDGTEKEVTVLYSWWQFLQIVNTKIYHLTDSEDKELGYFFAKPDSAEGISAKLFVNKVVFYLWTDVYKNYGVDNIFKGSDNGATTEEEKAKGVPFRQFFDEAGKNANMGTLKNFFKAIGLKSSLPTA